MMVTTVDGDYPIPIPPPQKPSFPFSNIPEQGNAPLPPILQLIRILVDPSKFLSMQ